MNSIHRHGLAHSLAAAILAAALAACSTSPTQKTAGDYLDDATTTTRIKSAFVADDQVSALDVGVKTYKGNVELTGFADNTREMQRAVEIARATPGVKSVRNDIRLKPH
jgi:hyperosmotically inducible periplasmic protein